MYPVTKAVAEQFKTNAKQNLSLLVNPVVGESFELTSADILSAGLNINRYSATGDSVALGVCSAADLSLRVENGDGRFNDVVFEGAQIYASVGVEDGNNTQWVPLGYFTVDNAPRRLAVISITALDGMVQFDKLANRSALSLPNSVKNIVLACCNECNITIDTDLDALPNSSFVAQSVGDSEDLTYRTILQCCCQIMGVNGYMNWDGHLELSWYKKDGIPETVSGSIATFESVTEVPASQLIVNVEPYQSFNGYDHPWVGGAGKNLLPITISSQTYNGITLTVNADGSIKVNGTATALTNFILTSSLALPDGTYVINGCPSGGGSSTYRLDVNDGSIGQDTGGSATFNVSGGTGIRNVRLRIASGCTVSNLVFWPMIRIAGSSNTFEPYENICPIYPANGINVLRNPYSSGETLTTNGITFTVNTDESVSIKGTATANADFYLVGANGVYEDANIKSGDYRLTLGRKGGMPRGTYVRLYVAPYGGTAEYATDASSEEVTIDATATYRIFIRVSNGATVNATFYPMISSAFYGHIGYSPYKGFSVTRTGKNALPPQLINGTAVGVSYSLNTDGSVTVSGTSTSGSSGRDYEASGYRPPNGTYTLSGGTADVGVRINRYTKDGTLIDRNTSYGTPLQIVIDDSVGYIYCGVGYVSANKTVDTTIYPQLELGTTAIAYEPYQGEVFCNVGNQDYYGGTLDVVSGVLTVTHALRNFDNYTGSITKSSNSNIKAGRCVYYINTTDTPWSGGDDNPRGIVMKCSIYDIGSKGYTEMVKKTEFAMGIGSYSGTYCMIGWNVDDSISTIEEFRTWLQSAHCDVWYPLRNPQTYQLTPTQVELLKGTNNIWADDSTLSVTYRAVTEITPADRYNSDIYENAVTITGVSVKGKENQSVVGSEDYALAIDGNPLFTDDDVETIANGLSGLIGFSYHPFSASVLPMPYLYPLDMVAVQYKDEWYDCAITEINFTSTAPTQLKGTGESAQSRSYARINPLTNRERAIIENLKDEMNTTLNKAVNNIIDFNNIISNALGLYHTNVADGSGGFIRYLHDAPDLESSTYIVTETAQGFAWTTNGWNGGTPVWQYGVTSGGYALFKWLSAEGIDVTRASSDYRAEVTPEHFNIYYKSDLIITIDATDRAIQTPRMVIPYSSTSNNSLRVGQLVWLPTPNGANAVVLGS